MLRRRRPDGRRLAVSAQAGDKTLPLIRVRVVGGDDVGLDHRAGAEPIATDRSG